MTVISVPREADHQPRSGGRAGERYAKSAWPSGDRALDHYLGRRWQAGPLAPGPGPAV